MPVSSFVNDLAYLFTYCLGDITLAIGGAFIGGAFIYSIGIVTIFMIRNQD